MIGVPHLKWTERPLLVVVPQPGKQPSKDELLAYFQVRLAIQTPSSNHAGSMTSPEPVLRRDCTTWQTLQCTPVHHLHA